MYRIGDRNRLALSWSASRAAFASEKVRLGWARLASKYGPDISLLDLK
jgi:hypothetical protein